MNSRKRAMPNRRFWKLSRAKFSVVIRSAGLLLSEPGAAPAASAREPSSGPNASLLASLLSAERK